MANWLIAASLVVPTILGVTVWQRATGRAPAWTTVVYVAASRVCHQRSDRSFHTAGVQWPVCGRCSGLYCGGAVGGLIALALRGRRQHGRNLTPWIIAAFVPTAATIAIEWAGLVPVSNALRASMAVPLGAAIAVAIILVTDRGSLRKAIR